MVLRRVKYNPAFLSEDELVRSFVVRHTDLELIVQVVRENVHESNQHVLVTGLRGSGKTSLALRVVAEVRRDQQLGKRWYPLVFPEESYQVSSPGEFWLEALFHLHQQTGDDRWKQTYDELRAEKDETRLRERALAQLMDFADAQGRRVLLVVENFKMLIGDQLSADDAWTLRHTLVNEPRVMMLATAIRRFKQVEHGGEALFELFRHQQLVPLDTAECGTLWASVTGKEPPDGRIRPIQILTGGNPRLVAIISSFAAGLSFKELMDDLMHLVDEHTEYFKRHLDDLPPVERKVYLALAELWDPATARDVARAARVEVSKTSALLNRLVRRGAVEVADERGRTKSYQVAERMYNIYYLMRRRGATSDRVKAVVNFMTGFYAAEELGPVARRIAEEACALEPERRGQYYLAYETVLGRLPTDIVRRGIVGDTPPEFLSAPDLPSSLREWTAPPERKGAQPTGPRVPQEVAPTDAARAPAPVPMESDELDANVKALLEQADALSKQPEQLEEAERLCRKAVELAPDNPRAWTLLALLQLNRGRYDEAEQASKRAIELAAESPWAWAVLGCVLCQDSKRYDEAEAACRKAIELQPEHAWAWAQLGLLLHEHTERYEEAEAAFRKAIEIDPRLAWPRLELISILLQGTDRVATALKVADGYLAEKPDDTTFLNGVAWQLYEDGRVDSLTRAAEWARQAVAQEPENVRYQHTLACILCASGDGPGALEATRSYAADAGIVEGTVRDAIHLFVRLAAAGYAREALDILRGSPSANLLEPLVVALRLFLGEEVKAAAEIREVAEDVVKKIQERRDELTGPRGSCKPPGR